MALPYYGNAIPEKYSCFLREPAPPEYIGFGRLILLGAAAARQIRERQKRIEEGVRFRLRRLAAGLSTRQAADRLGISRARLWRWETGRERMAAGALASIEGETR